MSYTRRYSETVTGSYSETFTVSYPASESGGSISKTVSGTVQVPVNINIHVDTAVFDRSVGGCRNSVTGLNAMVVATSLEEVKAKARTSRKVGESIVNGFFNYISSELSQQSQEYNAKCESMIIALSEQKKACGEKSEQMAGDYKRISSRYSKLFSDLDNELSTRIRAIDKPIFKLNSEMLQCSSRKADNSLLGVATIAAAESSRLESLLSATMIKQRTKESMQKTNNFLRNSYKLASSLESMLSEDSKIGDIFLPVLYLESTEEAYGVKRNVFGVDAPLLKKVDSIGKEVERSFQSENVKWNTISATEQEKITPYFNNEIEKGVSDPRVAKMILELASKNRPKVSL